MKLLLLLVCSPLLAMEADLTSVINKGPTEVKKYVTSSNVNQLDRTGQLPLVRAAQCGFLVTIQLLLAHGAKVNGVNRDNFSALWVAVVLNRPDIVNLLLDVGAQPTSEIYGLAKNQQIVRLLVKTKEETVSFLQAPTMKESFERMMQLKDVLPVEDLKEIMYNHWGLDCFEGLADQDSTIAQCSEHESLLSSEPVAESPEKVGSQVCTDVSGIMSPPNIAKAVFATALGAILVSKFCMIV